MSEQQKSQNERLKYLAFDRNAIRSLKAFQPTFLKLSVSPSSDRFITNFSLNENSPILVAANKLVKLSRNKIGEPLLKPTECKDFDLTDPNLYQTSIRYYPLHDPALKAHFQRSVVKKRLLDLNFVSEENDVYCTVREFNNYMRYLNVGYIKNENAVKELGVRFD